MGWCDGGEQQRRLRQRGGSKRRGRQVGRLRVGFVVVVVVVTGSVVVGIVAVEVRRCTKRVSGREKQQQRWAKTEQRQRRVCTVAQKGLVERTWLGSGVKKKSPCCPS